MGVCVYTATRHTFTVQHGLELLGGTNARTFGHLEVAVQDQTAGGVAVDLHDEVSWCGGVRLELRDERVDTGRRLHQGGELSMDGTRAARHWWGLSLSGKRKTRGSEKSVVAGYFKNGEKQNSTSAWRVEGNDGAPTAPPGADRGRHDRGKPHLGYLRYK
eukprot:scaffold1301_cov135-Isochrysis_galbana.AAC.2